MTTMTQTPPTTTTSRIIAPPPGKQFGTFDNLSDRRDLWTLLDRLSDGVAPEVGCERRRTFLRWCIRQSKGPGPILLDPKTVGLTREIYTDIVALAAVYGLKIERAAIELERWVRRLR